MVPCSETPDAQSSPAAIGSFVDAPFALLWIQHQQEPPFNHGCFGLKLMQVVCGDLKLALVSNMDISIQWLLSACPDLRSARNLVVVFHSKGGRDKTGPGHSLQERKTRLRAKEARMRESAAPLFKGEQLIMHTPLLDDEYGKHHSKFFILLYATGVRVVILTANFQLRDCNNKTQAIWYQDFPSKDAASPATSEFEDDLWEYLQTLSLPSNTTALLQAAIRSHDFSSARGALVASTPGRHRGDAIARNGHMRVRWLLEREEFDAKFRRAPLVCQFSSIGSLDEKWLADEFVASLSAGKVHLREHPAQDCSPSALMEPDLGTPTAGGVQLIWPTVEEVRQSNEGWLAGGSLPGRKDKLTRLCVTSRLHRWGGAPAHRQRAMPHIKTYCRYWQNEVAWCCIGSHNLSKAAWGQLRVDSTELRVLSFELSLLLLPRLEAAYRSHRHCGFRAGPIGLAAWTAPLRVCPLLACPTDLVLHIDERRLNDAHGLAVISPAMPSAAASSMVAAAAADNGAACATESIAIQAEHPAAGTPVTASPLAPTPASACLDVTFVAANQPVRARVNGLKRPIAASHGREGRTLIVPLPLPYGLPPEPYHSGDCPWMVDVQPEGLDAVGLDLNSAVLSVPVHDIKSQHLITPYFEENNSFVAYRA